MAFAPGRAAYVTFSGGAAKKFDSWSFADNADVVDVSDYDYRSAKYVRGLSVGSVTMSGPYDVNNLGLKRGEEYMVELGITATVFIATTIIITSIKLATTARGVARVDVTGVINADIDAEVTIRDYL